MPISQDRRPLGGWTQNTASMAERPRKNGIFIAGSHPGRNTEAGGKGGRGEGAFPSRHPVLNRIDQTFLPCDIW